MISWGGNTGGDVRLRLKGQGRRVGHRMGCRVMHDLLRGIQEGCGLVGRVEMSFIFFC